MESALDLINEKLVVNPVKELVSFDTVWIPQTALPGCRLDDCYCNYGKDIVDRTGYINPKQQIDNFRRAGKNLSEYRALMYSPEKAPEDMDVNPIARKDFDEFQAHDMARSIRARNDARRRENESLQRNEKEDVKEKKVVDTSGSEEVHEDKE